MTTTRRTSAAAALAFLVDQLIESVLAAKDATFGGIPEHAIWGTLQHLWPDAPHAFADLVITLMVRSGRVERTDVGILVAARE